MSFYWHIFLFFLSFTLCSNNHNNNNCNNNNMNRWLLQLLLYFYYHYYFPNYTSTTTVITTTTTTTHLLSCSQHPCDKDGHLQERTSSLSHSHSTSQNRWILPPPPPPLLPHLALLTPHSGSPPISLSLSLSLSPHFIPINNKKSRPSAQKTIQNSQFK